MERLAHSGSSPEINIGVVYPKPHISQIMSYYDSGSGYSQKVEQLMRLSKPEIIQRYVRNLLKIEQDMRPKKDRKGNDLPLDAGIIYNYANDILKNLLQYIPQTQWDNIERAFRQLSVNTHNQDNSSISWDDCTLENLGSVGLLPSQIISHILQYPEHGEYKKSPHATIGYDKKDETEQNYLAYYFMIEYGKILENITADSLDRKEIILLCSSGFNAMRIYVYHALEKNPKIHAGIDLLEAKFEFLRDPDFDIIVSLTHFRDLYARLVRRIDEFIPLG